MAERSPDTRGIRHPTHLELFGSMDDATENAVGAVADAFRGQGRTFLMPMGPSDPTNDNVMLRIRSAQAAIEAMLFERTLADYGENSR